ncbi:MFS monocarboxylate transporter-like protein [Xylogone sp. PMI_703]|nr:MFS monocarboxylate transporter-like protein [Xylogone sp. PMI_703]
MENEKRQQNSSENSLASAISTPASSNQIPNGGLTAWLQVLGSFIMIMNSWGIVNSFGVFQTYYESTLSESPSAISWIGSIQASLLLVIGIGTGPLYDAGYFRSLVVTGSVLIVLGMMMTSICEKYWQIMLAQALCIGVGCGCFFIPGLAIVAAYFSTKKAFATGIATGGSSLGGVIYPIIFRRLQPTLGFGWAVRIMAFIILSTLTVSHAVMRMPVLPSQRRKLWDISAFKEKPFNFATLGLFFGFMGLYIPFFYVQSYAIQETITSVDTAFYMLSILNASSTFGRIIPNFFADKTGPMNMIIPGAFATCVLAFSWIAIHSTAGLVVFCVLYGFFSGVFVSLPPTVMVMLSPNPGVIGTRMGMHYAVGAFGLLIGSPVAGQLIQHAGFKAAIAFNGATVAASVACFVAAKGAMAGLRWKTVT